jgi:hypothetical protein
LPNAPATVAGGSVIRSSNNAVTLLSLHLRPRPENHKPKNDYLKGNTNEQPLFEVEGQTGNIGKEPG